MSTENSGGTQQHLIQLVGDVGEIAREINVKINFDIIKLFSEGLYQSPHKAIEELVSNSYDAGASRTHILLPEKQQNTTESLWVIDDGCGMDGDGLDTLWQVARSPKVEHDVPLHRGRKPIGQFGIGKLAAYVLAWRLTHISKIGEQYAYVSMNFRTVQGRQWEAQRPLTLDLLRISEDEARQLVGEIRERDTVAWKMLFGDTAADSWTVAALSDFRDLANKLRTGVLRWVLSTGLPLTSDFAIHLNSKPVESSRASLEPMATLKVGDPQDGSAESLADQGVTIGDGGIMIPGIGLIEGQARVYRERLTRGKSSQVGRSHGFFIRVRGRVINLTDELFGLDVLNHAAWSRFTMTVNADGLRDYLQSSREGVREDAAVGILRDYLHLKFNECRSIYQRQLEKGLKGIDLKRLLEDTPSSLIRIPLIDTVMSQISEDDVENYYIRKPSFDNDCLRDKWLEELNDAFDPGLFDSVEYQSRGPYAPLAEYQPESRLLIVNDEHPFAARLLGGNTDRAPVTLFAQAEVLSEPILRDSNLPRRVVIELLQARDRLLRALTGQGPVVATEAMRLLGIADQDATAMERATGYAFEALGLRYTRRGRPGGHDGIVEAQLGLRGNMSVDYRAVFDAKTTSSERVAANDIPFSRIKQFKKDEKAQYAFVISKAYQGEEEPYSSANRSARDEKISLLRTDDLQRLLKIHLTYGITLAKLGEMFDGNYTALDTKSWIDELENELKRPDQKVPIPHLLQILDELKSDPGASPSLYAARERSETLKRLTIGRLEAALAAVSTVVGRGWIEVKGNGSVHLDQSPEQIIAELRRALRDDLHIQ